MESLDTSVPVTSVRLGGDHWNGRKWQTIEKEEDFFYDCLERSYRNTRFTMNRDRRVWDPDVGTGGLTRTASGARSAQTPTCGGRGGATGLLRELRIAGFSPEPMSAHGAISGRFKRSISF